MPAEVPIGTPAVVQLMRVVEVGAGSDRFEPISGLEASSASGSSQVPISVVAVEGPVAQGNTTRLLQNVNAIATQTKNVTVSATTINATNVQNTPYPYDPAQVAGGVGPISRATGGLLSVDNPIFAEGAITNDTGQRLGQDVRAFLYALDVATTTQAVRLRATAAGALSVDASLSIAGTIPTAADFQTIAATTSSLIAANTSRRVAIIQNLDATNSVRVGDSSTGAARGILIAPAESVTLETTAEIFVFPVAGTPLVSRTETAT